MTKINQPFYSANLSFYIILCVSIISIIPLFTIIINSSIIDFDFTLLKNSQFLEYTKNSLIILFFVLFLTFIFGVIPAYLVTFYNFVGVKFFKYSLILSFAIPPYIFGYSLSAFFENFGSGYTLINLIWDTNNANSYLPNFSPIVNSVLSLSFTLYGYVYLLSRTSFVGQSVNLLDLGKSLGFSSYQRFFKIILPCARPGIFIGLSLVAMETLSDFGTVSYFGVSTFTTEIYNSWFIFDDLNTSNFLSLLLLIFVLFFFIVESYLRKDSRFHSLKNEGKRKKQALKGTKNFLATAFCLCLFVFSFVFPFSQMLYWSIKFPEYLANFEILKLNLNTFLLIFFTSFFLISVAIFTNFGNRVLKNRFLSVFSSLSISGYAIPGIIISVSIISFFSLVSSFINFDLKTIFIGSFYGLILGYFFRFYSIAYNGIKSNFLKINYSLDESSYLMGFDKFKTFSTVHWPILNKNIFFIFILIAIEIIKELPITLILRPFNFETFSTRAYNFATQDLIEATAIPSIFLIFWASIFILISFKYFFQDNK